MTEKQSNDKTKVALVLGGGAPTLTLMAGALLALDEEGVEFDVISTSGAGMLIGLLYAAPRGMSRREALRATVNLGVHDAIYNYFPINYKVFCKPGPLAEMYLKTMTPFLNMLPHATDEQRLFKDMVHLWMAAWSPSSMTSDSLGMCAAAPWLEDVVDFAALENYPGEFLINAWNLREQKMRVFMKKEVSASHFRAALAFPLIYPPFELDGDHYIEGSAMDTLNLQGLLRFDENYDAGYQFKLKERLVEILPEIERILGAGDASDPRETYKAVEALVAAAEHAAQDYAFSRDKRDEAAAHRRKDKELDKTRAAELQKLRQISPAASALERESRQESEINAINKIIVFDVLGTEQLVRRPRNLYDAWVQQMIVPLVSISNENIKLFENQYDTGYGEEGRLLHRLRFADQIPLEHWPNVLDWSYSNMTTLFDAGYRAGKQFYKTHSWLAKGTGDVAG